MLRIAICDDSAEAVERIERQFDNISATQLKYDYDIFYDPQSLLTYQKENSITYNLYILDIEMKTMNGIDLANQIRQYNQKALIIFLTSHSRYVFDVFDVITFDFVVKPITLEKLVSILKKACNYLDMTKKIFSFSYKKSHFSIYCDEIIYFEKSRRGLFIITNSEKYYCNMTVSEVWEQLDNNFFAHIHSSYIINLAFITEISSDEVILKNSIHLRVAKSCRHSVREKHLQYLQRSIL